MANKIEIDSSTVQPLAGIIKGYSQYWQDITNPWPVTENEFRNTVPPLDDLYLAKKITYNFLDSNVVTDKNDLQSITQIMEQFRRDQGSSAVTNCCVYPIMSQMGWHTNSNYPGIRRYYTFSLGKTIFAYKHHGNIVYQEDQPGWTCREFEVGEDLYWHSIWTEKFRFSFGLRF